MSDVKVHASAHVPAAFPLAGRLPSDASAVRANYRKQLAEEQAHRQRLNAAQGGRGASTCAHSLPISLFFDGTHHNEPTQVANESPLHQAAFICNWSIATREWS
ncbi:hypothetical protein D3C84_777600 [compost metagenome]